MGILNRHIINNGPKAHPRHPRFSSGKPYPSVIPWNNSRCGRGRAQVCRCGRRWQSHDICALGRCGQRIAVDTLQIRQVSRHVLESGRLGPEEQAAKCEKERVQHGGRLGEPRGVGGQCSCQKGSRTGIDEVSIEKTVVYALVGDERLVYDGFVDGGRVRWIAIEDGECSVDSWKLGNWYG